MLMGGGHAKPGDQRRIIDLEDKPGFHHGFVVALAEVGQRRAIRLFRLGILVPEEVGYPPWAEQGKETIIHVGPGGRDARLHHRDFVLDRPWAPGRQRAGHHGPMRRRLERHAGHRGIPHGIVDRVELSAFGHLSFQLVGKEPGRLVGGHRLHCDPGGAAVVIPLVTRLPKLPITVEVMLQRHLLPHEVSHTAFHQCVKLCRVVSAGGEELSDGGGIGQPARVGGENPSFTALHARTPINGGVSHVHCGHPLWRLLKSGGMSRIKAITAIFQGQKVVYFQALRVRSWTPYSVDSSQSPRF